MNIIRKKIMLVDDNIANLAAGRQLLKPFYEVYPASSASQMFIMLEKILPDLILLDIDMPGMNGHEAIKILKRSRRFIDIPVIFLTAMSDESSELSGLDLGAVDYISKPFSPPRLLKRIETQLLIIQQKATIQYHADNLESLVQKKTREVFNLQNAMLDTIADLVEYRDKFTGGHITHTQLYLKTLVDELYEDPVYADEISSWDMRFLFPSAQLHDVGKIAIPDTILAKPGKLTPVEFEIMKTHVTIGVEAVKKIMAKIPEHLFMDHVLHIVGTHHEKWNGSGYPAGLKGETIPLEGRLMAIADVYDALISWRPYKTPYSHEEAKTIIEDGAGTHFDPSLVGIFLSVEHEFKQIRRRHEMSVE